MLPWSFLYNGALSNRRPDHLFRVRKVSLQLRSLDAWTFGEVAIGILIVGEKQNIAVRTSRLRSESTDYVSGVSHCQHNAVIK